MPDLPRLRLSSIDSIEVDDDLMRAIAEEERLMPHLHLSLQPGDDMILKRMKRRHIRADAVRFASEVRRLRPDIVFGADLIAGFPTETRGDVRQRAVASSTSAASTYLHVFPFSPRPGTPAARMPQLDRALDQGARRAPARRRARPRSPPILPPSSGAARQVLVERGGIGRTEHFTRSAIDAGAPGAIVPARITGRTARALVATALAEAA